MKATKTVYAQDIERLGKIELVQSIDVEKVIADQVPPEHLDTAGAWVVRFTPKARGSEPKEQEFETRIEATSWILGFEAAIAFSRKPRKPRKPRRPRDTAEGKAADDSNGKSKDGTTRRPRGNRAVAAS